MTALRSEVAAEIPNRDQRSRLIGRARTPLYSLLFLVVVLGIWEWFSSSGLVHPVILPPPSAVGGGFIDLILWPPFPRHVGVTLFEVLVGWTIGCAIGAGLGVLLALVPVTRDILYPYIVGFQSLPKVALAPLFVTWFGFGLQTIIVMSVAICFFPVMVNTFLGLTSVDESAYKMMRSLTASRLQIFTKLRFPGALPMIMAGLKTSLTFATIGAIVGEFIGGKEGLGYLVHVFNFQFKIETVFAVIIFLALFSTILYLIIDRIDRRIVFWVDREQV